MRVPVGYVASADVCYVGEQREGNGIQWFSPEWVAEPAETADEYLFWIADTTQYCLFT